MYERSAKLYDAIYRSIGKDYEHEAAELHTIISRHKRSAGNRLLDVACGTGLHLQHLKELYRVQGLDRSPGMLDVARERCPEIRFHHADMTNFDLGEQFDVVTCLFSSIGYMRNPEELQGTLANMARHLVPGGILIVEPWLHPETYKPGRPFLATVDEPELKIARLNVSRQKGIMAVVHFHYLVATTEDIEHFTEYHELALFNHEEYLQAFQAAGLDTAFQPEGLMGRGVYYGVRPPGGS
jgi:ubiquinone/menaquinone biosynthesis C-methylase UbiE